MNVVALGLSHHSAPISLLEELALAPPQIKELTARCLQNPAVSEIAVLSTCNRLEVYAVLTEFHAGVEALSSELCRVGDVTDSAANEHLFVRYGNAAIEHLFKVTAGLDSMAVGETQILGQVRSMLIEAQDTNTVDAVLDPLLQRALRVGKSVHQQTDLDSAAPSLLEGALRYLQRPVPNLRVGPMVLFGAGGMSGLVVSRFAEYGAQRITVVNRSLDRAQRRAESVGGVAVPLADTEAVIRALSEATTVVAATGAMGHIVTYDLVAAANSRRGGAPQAFIDLGLPRDIDPRIDALPGVHRVDLERLRAELAGHESLPAVERAERIVGGEVEAYVAERSATAVGPTLAALQQRSNDVVESEFGRLKSRLGPDASDDDLAHIQAALRRVAAKLMHTPTVTMKARATGTERTDYVQAVRTLFDLDHADQSTVAEVQSAVPPATLAPVANAEQAVAACPAQSKCCGTPAKDCLLPPQERHYEQQEGRAS